MILPALLLPLRKTLPRSVKQPSSTLTFAEKNGRKAGWLFLTTERQGALSMRLAVRGTN